MKKYFFLALLVLIFLSCATKYAKLDKESQKLYKEIVYIASQEEMEEFMNLPKEQREEWVEKFWKKRDPTPTTERNERREEHHERIEYANEHFSLEVADVPGWKTDIGRIYIKYGAPDKIENKDIGLRQTWIYFSYGLRYNFDDFGRIIHPFPGDQEYEVFINSQLNAPLDAFKLGGGRFKANFDYALFQRDGKVLLEIYYEIPLEELYFSENDSFEVPVIEERFAIFDTTGMEITKEVEKTQITQLESPGIVDGIKKIEFATGTYQFAFSLVNLEVKKNATFRKIIKLPEIPEDVITLSDIQLAKVITTEKLKKSFQKGKYNIIPNPTATYQKGGNLYLYYEVYNLHKNPDGKTNIEVEYRIRGKNLLWDTMYFTKEYEFTEENVSITEALSLDEAPFDTYSLHITVKDKNKKNQIGTNQKFFDIIGWSVY